MKLRVIVMLIGVMLISGHVSIARADEGRTQWYDGWTTKYLDDVVEVYDGTGTLRAVTTNRAAEPEPELVESDTPSPGDVDCDYVYVYGEWTDSTGHVAIVSTGYCR